MDVKTLINDGFVISPYYSVNDAKSLEKFKKIELTAKDIRQIIVGTSEQRLNLLFIEETLVLVKYLLKYHVTPNDLVERFENELKKEDGPDYDELISWTHFSALKDDTGFIFTPHLDDKYFQKDQDGLNDYMFDKDDHVVAFVTRLIRENLRQDHLKEDLTIYINFIIEVLSQRNLSKEKRTYSKDSLSLILNSLCYESYCGKTFNEEIIQFYTANLLLNAEQEDNRSMRTLGYEYYEGSNGFPCDPNKACYWLEKYYKATEDPDVARTLGYIYYYGRTTNGVPEGDKAFQYFAIGHIAGKYFEATYKLADCYVKGYGTPVNHQSAYTLVKEIYEPTLNHFLNGDDSKFADVALRLGSYYKDGIYVEKNLYEAYLFYLEAKCAIKKRLENMEYIGDRGVAMSISKSLDEIQSQIGIQNRIIKKSGYLITNPGISYKNRKFKVELADGYIHIIIEPIKKDGEKYILNDASQIGFIERSERVEYYLKPELMDEIDGFVESANEYKIEEIALFNDKVYIILNMGKDGEFPAMTTCSEIVFVPQTIKDVSKQYQIVSVEFYHGSKLYDYLCINENVKVGDQVKVKSNGETKIVTVKNIKLLYEDQLPLPYLKMSKAC